MKIFKLMLVALVAMCGLASCNDSDHDFIDVDYSKSILGIWSAETETFEEGIRFYEDGKFTAFGDKGEGEFFVDGTWTLNRNRLLLTTDEGQTHFSGIIEVYAGDVMLMTSDVSKDTYVYHYYVDSPFPKSLVGTWTCQEGNFAEALTIHEDGSLVSTRLEGENYWEGMKGSFMEEKGTYGIELNGDYAFGTYEVVSGELLVFIDAKTKTRRTYRYCKEDLSEEIVGRWIIQDHGTDMSVMTFHEDGRVENVGYFYAFENWFDASESCNYKVIGDLLFRIYPDEDGTDVVVTRLDYTPGDYPLSDVMAETRLIYIEGAGTWESVYARLRVKQSLDLTGMKYDYNDLFFLDVKGKDQDINFLGFTMNLGKMEASGLDTMLKSVLFHIEFPDANTLSYTYTMGGKPETYSAPVEVEDSKFTVKMSQKVPTLKDVVFYAYQDTNDSQMRLYMQRDTFVNFFTNMQAMQMAAENPEFDITNAEAIDAIYNNLNEVVENIDFCIIMNAEQEIGETDWFNK